MPAGSSSESTRPRLLCTAALRRVRAGPDPIKLHGIIVAQARARARAQASGLRRKRMCPRHLGVQSDVSRHDLCVTPCLHDRSHTMRPVKRSARRGLLAHPTALAPDRTVPPFANGASAKITRKPRTVPGPEVVKPRSLPLVSPPTPSCSPLGRLIAAVQTARLAYKLRSARAGPGRFAHLRLQSPLPDLAAGKPPGRAPAAAVPPDETTVRHTRAAVYALMTRL